MASVHLCTQSANFQKIRRHFYTTTSPPVPRITSITNPCCYHFSSLRSCQKRAVPGRNAYIACDVHTSAEGSICASAAKQESPLKIGIIGMGTFGQFLSEAFQRQGHNILATSRSDYSEYCQEHGIEFFQQLNDLCDAQPDVLLICSSILSTEKIVRGIPFHKLKPNTIIADVLSVKLFPKNLLLEVVPSGFGILCTHPMFGKFSAKNGWAGLRFAYEKVRISESSIQEKKCEQFLDIFRDERCKMVEMSCEEHDEYAAESQFVTHTVARILSNMNLEATPIDTKGYETLVQLTNTTVSDSSDLYDGLFLYNVNSARQIKKFEEAFDGVKKTLFAKLRASFARQMEDAAVSTEEQMVPAQSTQFLPSSEKVLTNVSSFSLVDEEVRSAQLI